MVGPSAGREALKRLVREATPTVALRDELKARYGRPAEPVERAFEALFINRTSYSGNLRGGPLGGRHQTGKTKIGSRWNPGRICGEIDRAHALLAGRCEVLNEDASSLLGALVGQDRTFAYADPPYFRVGNTLYREGMTPLEHARLAERLRVLSNWVLSYDDAPEIRALYHWAVAMPLVARYSVAKANGTRKVRQELLILPPSHPIVASAAAARRAA
jgi:DNA adenine methylase